MKVLPSTNFPDLESSLSAIAFFWRRFSKRRLFGFLVKL